MATDQPTYRQGGGPTITVAVDNASQSAVSITFPSAQRFDLVVLAGDREVWRWSADRNLAQVESETQFPPGLTLLGRVTWDWRDATGAPLAPGSYRLAGTLSGGPSKAGNTLLIELSAP